MTPCGILNPQQQQQQQQQQRRKQQLLRLRRLWLRLQTLADWGAKFVALYSVAGLLVAS
jgi:hypothetical protein